MHGYPVPSVSVPGGSRPVPKKARVYPGAKSRASVTVGKRQAHKYRGKNCKLTPQGTYIPQDLIAKKEA